MELTLENPTIVKKVNATKQKTIQFLNADGVKKVFDVHRYSKAGLLYFKRKKE